MQGYGLSVKAINAITKMEMQQESKNIWKHVESHTTVLLISPEMLATSGFQQLLQTNKFKKRIYALIIDEIHLLISWGASFRPLFQQIGFLRARFPSDTVLLGLTATLRKNKFKESVFRFLGLQASKVHFIRRSNARPDVTLLIRTLRANTNTEHFPELDWVLREKGHALIFCPSIRTGFRLAVYLWHLDPKSAVVNQNIRLFNSLNSTEYNSKTLQLLQDNERAKITIATDKLSMGVDVPNFETVTVIDPIDLDDLWQKSGRVGRDKQRVKSPRVIIYIPNHKMATLKDLVAESDRQGLGDVVNHNRRQKKSHPTRWRQTKQAGDTEIVDESLARVVTAKCPVKAIDEEYDNPTFDAPCSDDCTTCSKSLEARPTSDDCRCSGCQPEIAVTPGTATQSKQRKKAVPLNIRVTKAMRVVGMGLLYALRDDLWEDADELTAGMVPLESFLPDSVMEDILDGFPYLLSRTTIESLRKEDGSFYLEASSNLLKPFVTDNIHLIGKSSRLLNTCLQIHSEFDRIREEKKKVAKEKREALKSAAEIPADSSAISSSDSPEESEAEGVFPDATASHLSRSLRVDLQ